MKSKAYRLPTHVLPERYDIHLDARLDRATFTGRVTLAVRVVESRDTVDLHARDMSFSRVIARTGDRTLEGRVDAHPEQETITLHFDEALPEGDATLELDYEGHVSKNMEGLYLAQDGPEKCLATQCEETDARAIFPCFDEPTFKARFAWRVTTDAEMTVLANGPVEDVADAGDGSSRTWTFAPTKPMSSYLVAITIGKLEGTDPEDVNGTPLRVWAMEGKSHMGASAQTYAERLLPWFETYFDHPYHFEKYDQVAVPGFAAGAMENSGLVLFRQHLLLMQPGTASWRQEKLIARVVAHEMAHMWFGNLVTMRWWDDLWLNEAFAEWIAHEAVHAVRPDYEVWHDFEAGKRGAMVSDALESTHPIYAPVETPEEATELFDAITYQKGSAVLRMLEHYLGADAFREGLRSYMREFRESNAEGQDLWRHLDEASGEPVGRIMESWITQGGYPVVTVSSEDTFGTTRLHVQQARFHSKPGEAGDGRDPTWNVPLVIRYGDDAGAHETRVLLNAREAVIPLDVDGEIQWCYANAGEIGFYRQNLSKVLLKRALRNLDRFTPAEQMGFLDDQWALARNDTQPVTSVLDTLQALMGTREHNVLDAVVDRLYAVEDILREAEDDAALNAFRGWVDRAFAPQLEELGLEPAEGESRNDAERRVRLLDAVARLARNPDVTADAVALADREATDPGAVDPNIAPVVVRVAATTGDAARFDKHRELYESRRAESAPPQVTNRYLHTLPSFEDPELVTRTLRLLDEKVIPQEAVGPVLRLLLGTRHGRVSAWTYMKRNWQWLRETLGDMWTGMLVEGTGNLPKDRRDDMVAFFDENLKDVAQQAYARALESLDQRAAFHERVTDDVVKWFRDKTA